MQSTLHWIKREAISNDGKSVEAALGLRSGCVQIFCVNGSALYRANGLRSLRPLQSAETLGTQPLPGPAPLELGHHADDLEHEAAWRSRQV